MRKIDYFDFFMLNLISSLFVLLLTATLGKCIEVKGLIFFGMNGAQLFSLSVGIGIAWIILAVPIIKIAFYVESLPGRLRQVSKRKKQIAELERGYIMSFIDYCRKWEKYER